MFGDLAMKFSKTLRICSLVLVVLKSLEEVPSLILTPSIRKPNVAVDDIVSLQTMYLFVSSGRSKVFFFVCFDPHT